jgi:ribosomal protein S17
MSNVAKVLNGEEELAVTWERIVFDHPNYVIKITYDRKKTVITFYSETSEGVLGDVVIIGESRKIASSLNMPLVDNHN